MMRDRTQIALGATLLGAFACFWRWHSPRASKLTQEEIDHYLELVSQLPLPGDEAERLVARLRPWAEADDGKAVYMLNLMRYFPELRRWPGAPEFVGTPTEANAHYERNVTPLWLRNASYPLVGGPTQGPSLITTEPDVADWSRALVVRCPSRRTFLRLLADPSYAPVEPYKRMALELDLVPLAGERVIPDLRWIVGGGLLAVYLGVGWSRAARRRDSPG
jgi:hypothetical protein